MRTPSSPPFSFHSNRLPRFVEPHKTACAMEHSSLYVAIGLQRQFDPGYNIVLPAIETLGQASPIGSSLWHLATTYGTDEAFKQINTSMMDRRIAHGAGLLVLDPSRRYAKWHLRQPLSDLIAAHWNYQNNLFISFSTSNNGNNYQTVIHRIAQLGTWAPISRSTWYVSSSVSSKDAFHYMLQDMTSGDRLCVFDSAGNQAVWKES